MMKEDLKMLDQSTPEGVNIFQVSPPAEVISESGQTNSDSI